MRNLLKGANLSHLKATAQQTKGYMVLRLGDITVTVAEALEELAGALNDAAYTRHTLSIPVSAWAAEGEGNEGYCCTVAVEGVTAQHRADVILDEASVQTAASAGMQPVTETVEGGVVLRSEKAPEDTLTGELYITLASEGGD